MTAAASGTRRGNRLLIAVIVLAVLAALVTAGLRGAFRDGPLEPDAPTPQGSRAVVEVLQDGGVDVSTQRHTEDAADALAGGAAVLVTAPNSLNSQQLALLQESLEAGDGHLVLVQPNFVTTTAFIPGARPSGTLDEATALSADPACGPAAFQARALEAIPVEGVTESDTLYSVPDGAAGCFSTEEGSAVVTQGQVTVLGTAAVLANETVAEADNAAVALNALGAQPQASWYIPSATDPMSTLAPTLVDYIPDWAAPVALWVVLATVLLLIALGWRLGPVVVEPLPVTVRAHELTIGRARMMHRARARDRAARSLRSATAVKLAHRLGMRRENRLEALIRAIEPHTDSSEEQLRDLFGPTPLRSDGDLVQLAHDLDRLDKEISR